VRSLAAPRVHRVELEASTRHAGTGCPFRIIFHSGQGTGILIDQGILLAVSDTLTISASLSLPPVSPDSYALNA
jgi:hypothetical protein